MRPKPKPLPPELRRFPDGCSHSITVTNRDGTLRWSYCGASPCTPVVSGLTSTADVPTNTEDTTVAEQVLTKPQSAALVMILEHGPLAESNKTDAEALTIYHQTAANLRAKGMVMQFGTDGFVRPLWGLTDVGESAARRIQAATNRG